MTSVEKLFKTFELVGFTKKVNGKFVETSLEEKTLKINKINKNDKIKICILIADFFWSTQNKDINDIQNLIKISIEIFFYFTNDKEADVRICANECLDKLINSKLTDNFTKILTELLKEVQKNESSLSIKSALSRFTTISHLMRPSKCKICFVTLIPCLIKLSERIDDELIQETLHQNIDVLMKNFIKFGYENDIISLINAFFKNFFVKNQNCRRVAAQCLTSICKNSKKNHDLIFYLLNKTINYYLEFNFNSENYNQSIIEQSNNINLNGIFSCIKVLLPFLKDFKFRSKSELQRDLLLDSKEREIFIEQTESIKENLILFFLILLQEIQVQNNNQTIFVLLETVQEFLKSTPQIILVLFKDFIQNREYLFQFKIIVNNDKLKLINCLKDNFNDCNNKTYLSYLCDIICKKFLLKNSNLKTFTDEEVKVSIKVIALNCISKIVEYSPDCLNNLIYEPNIKVLDVLLYSNFTDANLIGQCSLISGNFIKSKLIFAHFNVLNLNEKDCELIFNLFFKYLFFSLNNESNISLRFVLIAIKNCINEIIKSNSFLNLIIIELIKKLLTFSNHLYWLIKIQLIEIFTSIDYCLLSYVEKEVNSFYRKQYCIQTLIVEYVFNKLLVDNDYRVRNTCKRLFSKLVKKFYFNNYKSNNDEIISLAQSLQIETGPQIPETFFYDSSFNGFFKNSKEKSIIPNAILYSKIFFFPFSKNQRFLKHVEHDFINNNLEKIVIMITNRLIENIDNKLVLKGCIGVLTELSEFYPCTIYQNGWVINSSRILKLINILTNYLTTTQNVILDIFQHGLILKLISNLICGRFYWEINENNHKMISISDNNEKEILNEENLDLSKQSIENKNLLNVTESDIELDLFENWGLISKINPDLQAILQKITLHLIRLIHIYSTVFSEDISENQKNYLKLFKNNVSLFKKRNSKAYDFFEKADIFKKFNEKDKSNQPKRENHYLLHFSHTKDPYLIKLYYLIKKLYGSTVNTLDFWKLFDDQNKKDQNKLIVFLEEIFTSFSKILELGNFKYFSKISEDLVNLINPIFVFESRQTVIFLKQLIKVIFGINFASIIEFENEDNDCINYYSFMQDYTLVQRQIKSSLPKICISNDYEKLKETFTVNNTNKLIEFEKVYYDVFYRKILDKRIKVVLKKTFNENINNNSLSYYLQFFEPLLTESIKYYTSTSDLKLHCAVLDFLSELVKLRVNYNLLDTDQSFFTFINKQFDFIENEQVSNSNLIKSIFSFLIALSYEKNTNVMVNYSRILQILDHLQASEANFDENVYPGLKLIVEDLFLIKTISNLEILKELEIHKKFITNLLIKLCFMPKVIYLLNIILIQYKIDDEEKLKKLSIQIMDQFLLYFNKGCVSFKNMDDINIVIKLFNCVNPIVFRPIDFILNELFSCFDDNLLNDHQLFLKYFAHKIILFQVMIGKSKEDIILTRLNELKVDLYSIKISPKLIDNYQSDNKIFLYSLPIFCHYKNKYTEFILANVRSEEIIAKFILKLICLAFHELCSNSISEEDDENYKEFLVQQLNLFISYLNYIAESSVFPKIIETFKTLINENENEIIFYFKEINAKIIILMIKYPLLSIKLFNFSITFKNNFINYNDDYIIEKINNKYKVEFDIIVKILSSLNSSNKCFTDLYYLHKTNIIDTKKLFFSSSYELISECCFLILCDDFCKSSLIQSDISWFTKEYALKAILFYQELPIKKLHDLIRLNLGLTSKFLNYLNLIIHQLINDEKRAFLIEKLMKFLCTLDESFDDLVVEFIITKITYCEKINYLVSIKKLSLKIVIDKFSKYLNREDDSKMFLSSNKCLFLIETLENIKTFGITYYLNSLKKIISIYYGNVSSLDQGEKDENIENSFTNETFNSNQLLFINTFLENNNLNDMNEIIFILNNKFSTNELIEILKHSKLKKDFRIIHFMTNVFENINSILQKNLNCDKENLDVNESLFKSNKFNLVIAVRTILIKKYKDILNLINFDIEKFSYVPLLVENEIISDQERLYRTQMFDFFTKNKEELCQMSNLFSNFLYHLNLIIKFKEFYNNAVLKDEISKNEENVKNLINFVENDYRIILRIAIMYNELIINLVDTNKIDFLNDCLKVTRSLIENNFLIQLLSSYNNNPMQFTVISSIYLFYKSKFEKFNFKYEYTAPKHFYNKDESSMKYFHSHNACIKMGELVQFLLKEHITIIDKGEHNFKKKISISYTELDDLANIVLNLSTLPLVNSFILVPPQVWEQGLWMPTFICLKKVSNTIKDEQNELYESDTFCATLPSENLCNYEILNYFLKLINLLGFNNKIQFEEIWMSLLGVIYQNTEQYQIEKPVYHEDLMLEELNEKANLVILAIKGVASILIQCSFVETGFPIRNLKLKNNRIYQSEIDNFNRKNVFMDTKFGSKLFNVNKCLSEYSSKLNFLIKFSKLNNNLNEDLFQLLILGEMNYNFNNLVLLTEQFYENRYGLYSIEFIKNKFSIVKELNDFNQELSSPSSNTTPVHLVTINKKSELSNLNKDNMTFKILKQKENILFNSFDNRFGIDVNSCLHLFLDIYKQMFRNHIAIQEQILKSIVRLSDLFFDVQQYVEFLNVFLDLFKTAFYQEDEILLQYLILGICKFYSIVHETSNNTLLVEKLKKCIEISLRSPFFPTRINCLVGLNFILQDKLNAINKGRLVNQKDSQIYFILKDYILKNLFDKELDNNVEHCLLIWNSTFLLIEYLAEDFDESDLNQKIFKKILLVLSDCDNIQIFIFVSNGVQKLLIDEFFRIKECNLLVKICIDKLKEKSFYDYQSYATFYIFVTCIYVFGLSANNNKSNLDDGILNCENINILFNCLKYLDCNNDYLNLILNCLPNLSIDFIPEQNLLNKVISEFLSNQNHNVKYFAIIMNRIFEKLHKQSKQTLINDWVCLSLKSFVQIKPLEFAISSLLILFISATDNDYIRCFFQKVVFSFGHINKYDKELLKTILINYLEELNEENYHLVMNALKYGSTQDIFYQELVDHVNKFIKKQNQNKAIK